MIITYNLNPLFFKDLVSFSKVDIKHKPLNCEIAKTEYWKIMIWLSRHKMLSFGSTMQVISVLPKFRAGALCQNLNFCSIEISHRRTYL